MKPINKGKSVMINPTLPLKPVNIKLVMAL